MQILEYGNPELENYYISQHGNRVFAIYGMSMGGEAEQGRKSDVIRCYRK